MTPIYVVAGQSNAGRVINSNAIQNYILEHNLIAETVMVAQGGTKLAADSGKNDWFPFEDGGAETGELFVELLDQIDEKLSAVEDGYVAGVLWVQGEADSNHGHHDEYQSNLQELYDRLTARYGEDLKFGVSEFSQTLEAWNDRESQVKILEAQRAFAAANENAFTIDPEDAFADAGLPMTPEAVAEDRVHYNEAGAIAIADAFMSIMLNSTGGGHPVPMVENGHQMAMHDDAGDISDAHLAPAMANMNSRNAMDDHGGHGGHGDMDMEPIKDNDAFLMAMGEGSRIEIHAADAAKDSWTQLNVTAEAGDRVIRVTENTGWEVGDKIAIASTGFDMEEAEERTITNISANGQVITLDRPLQHRHNGEIEEYDNGKSGAAARSWDLDLRAEVALLSRNVTITGDENASQDQYGGHTMVMHGAEMHIDGAEFTKMGQAGLLGKYALHWHKLDDASGQYVTNSSIHETYNKGMTIHGTQNTWVENNAIYNTIGHTYYLEDGSEFGNVLKDNLGINTYKTDSRDAGPIGSDFTAVSTFWISNPDNHLIGNHAAGSEDTGIWVLSQRHVHEGVPEDERRYADYVPLDQDPGQWIGNVAHTNEDDGIFIAGEFEIESGNDSYPGLNKPIHLEDFTSYKNGNVGVWTKNAPGDYYDLKIADSQRGIQVWGNTRVDDSLFVGESRTNSEGDQGGSLHGIQGYDSASFYNHIHFANFDGDRQAAIGHGEGAGKNTTNTIQNATFENVSYDNKFRGQQYSNARTADRAVNDEDNTMSGAWTDVNGDFFGIEGAVITAGMIDHFEERNIDEERRGDNIADDIEAIGFNKFTDDAVWHADARIWINSSEANIAKLVINGMDDLVITRSDTGASIRHHKGGRDNQTQLNADVTGNVEYILEYNGNTPDRIDIQLRQLAWGEHTYFRVKDIPNDAVIQQADEVGSMNALRNAEGSAWYRANNGDLVIKMYGNNANREDPRFDTDHMLADRIYIVTDNPNARSSGDPRPRPIPDRDTWDFADPTPLPERAESTSRTIDDVSGLARWSDLATWGGTEPGDGDVVVIGPGQKVVLDTSISVEGIIVHGEGSALIIEDEEGKQIDLITDWMLVNAGGLFQAGSENDPLDTDFILTLAGDDANQDLDISSILNGEVNNTVFADVEPDDGHGGGGHPMPNPGDGGGGHPMPNPGDGGGGHPMPTPEEGIVRGRFYMGEGSDEFAVGHQVSLYRNGTLIESSVIDQNGMYLFENVTAGGGYYVRFFAEDSDLEFDTSDGGGVGQGGNYNTPRFEVSADQIVVRNANFLAEDDGTGGGVGPAPNPGDDGDTSGNGITATTDHNTTVSVDVMNQDFGLPGQNIRLESISYNDITAKVAIEDGMILVDPLAASTAARYEEITYTVRDENGNTATGRVTVEIGAGEASNSGTQILFGHSGNSLLFGGSDIDRFAGGTGSDTFVFEDDGHLDVVYGFEDGVDLIGLKDLTFDEVEISQYRGSDTLVSSGDTRMILKDQDFQEISISDFELV